MAFEDLSGLDCRAAADRFRRGLLIVLCAATPLTLSACGRPHASGSRQESPAGQQSPAQAKDAELDRFLSTNWLTKNSEREVALAPILKRGSQVLLPYLATSLGHSNATVRANAASVLGELGDPAAIAPLSAVLSGDSDSLVRGQAAYALGHYTEPRAVDALLAALTRETDPMARSWIALGLGNTRDPRAVAPLIAVLEKAPDDFPEFYRSSVAHALATIRTEPALRALRRACRDRDLGVRLAVGPIVKDSAKTAPDCEMEVGRSDAKVNRACNDLLCFAVLSAVHGEYGLNYAAISRIGLTAEPKREMACLFALLHHGTFDERRNAALVLANLGELPGEFRDVVRAASAQPLLATIREDDDDRVRRAAVEALVILKAVEALPGLRSVAATDSYPSVRALARRAIEQIDVARAAESAPRNRDGRHSRRDRP